MQIHVQVDISQSKREAERWAFDVHELIHVECY